jgi:hypothetical protein
VSAGLAVATAGPRRERSGKATGRAVCLAFPADRFIPRPADERLPLRLPNTLTPAAPAPRPASPSTASTEPALPTPPVVSPNGGEPALLLRDCNSPAADESRARQPASPPGPGRQ